jgi:hypothetical protein
MFHAYRVLKAVHTQGDDALELAHEGVERFRNRNVLYFLDALAAMAYASRMISGQVPDVIQWELGAFDILGAIGKKDLLKIQGFLE